MKQERSGRELQVAARRKKIAAFAVLLLALGGVWGRAYLAGSPQSARADAESDTIDASGNPGAAVTSTRPRVVHVDWPAVAGRDPFGLDASVYARRPATVEHEPEPVVDPVPSDTHDTLLGLLELQGTFLGEDPVAIINGRRHRVGQIVGGFVVTRIEYRRVIVTREGVEYTLGM